MEFNLVMEHQPAHKNSLKITNLLSCVSSSTPQEETSLNFSGTTRPHVSLGMSSNDNFETSELQLI